MDHTKYDVDADVKILSMKKVWRNPHLRGFTLRKFIEETGSYQELKDQMKKNQAKDQMKL